MIWLSCGICLVTFHWLTLLYAIWSRVNSFLIMEWSPLGGSFPLGPVLGFLVKTPTFFGEARLNVLPFNPVIGYISCWITSNMVCYVTWSSTMTDGKTFTFCLVNFPAGWSQQCGIQSWEEIFLDVLGIASAHLGFFPYGGFIGFRFLFGLVFGIEMVCTTPLVFTLFVLFAFGSFGFQDWGCLIIFGTSFGSWFWSGSRNFFSSAGR